MSDLTELQKVQMERWLRERFPEVDAMERELGSGAFDCEDWCEVTHQCRCCRIKDLAWSALFAMEMSRAE